MIKAGLIIGWSITMSLSVVAEAFTFTYAKFRTRDTSRHLRLSLFHLCQVFDHPLNKMLSLRCVKNAKSFVSAQLRSLHYFQVYVQKTAFVKKNVGSKKD